MPRGKLIKEPRICETCGGTFLFYLCPSFIKRGYGRFCSQACCIASRTIPLSERFEKYIGAITETGCILWTGAINDDGYGVIGSGTRNGQMLLAHRAAYELKIGPIPEGVKVLHRCDNPPCINHEHFFLGTQADNMADMVSKRRGRKRVPGSRRYLKDMQAS